MDQETFILVQDKQRKCLYLTLASTFKNSEGLEVIEKFPNAARAIQALQKYSKQKIYGKMNLKDALGEEYGDEETYSSSAKGQKINRQRAEQEMKNHSHQRGSPEWNEFEKLFGPQFKTPGYIDAGKLMDFLGY